MKLPPVMVSIIHMLLTRLSIGVTVMGNTQRNGV